MPGQRVVTLIVALLLLTGVYVVGFSGLFAPPAQLEMIARSQQPRQVRDWMVSAPMTFNLGGGQTITEIRVTRLTPPEKQPSVIVEDEPEGPYVPEVVWHLKGRSEDDVQTFQYRSYRGLDGLEQVVPDPPLQQPPVEGETEQEKRDRERENRRARWRSQPPQLEPGVEYRLEVTTTQGSGELVFEGVPVRRVERGG